MKATKTGPFQATRPDSATFDAIFLENWGPVYRLLERIVGDRAEAEDLALETFYRLYRTPPKAGPEANLGGWLHRVAVNLALRSIRSHKRRESYELEAGKIDLEDRTGDGPAELVDRRETRRLARKALARMNSHRAELLILRHSGMAYKEIAASMHLSPSSIGPLLLRAEREFEKVYRDLSKEEEP